ncbi:MAG: hypothetical protein KGK18_08625, partial [Burkholderiales bacterium]|nr:hypothetical protein [Burkholderiales bacterium]
MASTRMIQVVSNSVAQSMTLVRTVRRAAAQSTVVFLRDVGQGLLEVSHNTLALLGLALAALVLFAAGRADVRHDAETWALGWLQAREEARADPA